MRHRVAHRKLGRVTEHRISMLRNQAQALLRHERIETTMPKAKELRPFVERLITIAKRGLAAGEGNGRTLHARRLVLQDIQDRDVVGKLFDTIAPRFEARPGGSFNSGQQVAIAVDTVPVGVVILTLAPSGELSGELEFDSKPSAAHTPFPPNFPDVSAGSMVEAKVAGNTVLGCELQ